MLTVNVEELNYLAKRLDSFDTGEAAQFQAMAHKLELFELKDLINLTFCCQQATVITDFSDLAAIGRDHYMNLHGGSASVDELNELDGKGTARQLIESGSGTITPYGVVYDNGMKLEQVYDGRFFPCYYYEPNAITVAVTSKTEPEDTEHKLIVRGTEINVQWDLKRDDFLSLTDIAKIKDNDNPRYIIQNWLRNRNTIEFLGVWETLYNPNFNRVEFDAFRSQAGLNSFVMTPQKWVDATGAIGIVSKAGRYGGTYAHKEIAFEFASWISVEFKLYLVKEFERLKTEEMKQLGWDIKRNLAKINYRIHTDAIKENLIPPELSARQISLVYANEADVLNMALFGMTAKQWRDSHPDLKGNIRDYANVSQLVCLSNLENLNAVFINEGISQSERLAKLNAIAISQMKVLTEDHRLLQLEAADDTEKPQ